jgi:RNA polymerase sigma-70 factor (ECF subfamily)
MKARAGSYNGSTDLLLVGSRSSRGTTDEDPVERAKRDPAAFGDLYDRYCGLIYRYIYSRVRDRSLAEDITEDVFFKALKHIHQYRNMGRPFSSWLYQIATRAVADHYRADRGELDLEQAQDLPAPDSNVLDEVIRRERSRCVWQAIDRLPRQQRTAMALKFSEDKTLEEIGQVMGKSSAAVKVLVYRAVQRLRRELPPLESDEF